MSHYWGRCLSWKAARVERLKKRSKDRLPSKPNGWADRQASPYWALLFSMHRDARIVSMSKENQKLDSNTTGDRWAIPAFLVVRSLLVLTLQIWSFKRWTPNFRQPPQIQPETAATAVRKRMNACRTTHQIRIFNWKQSGLVTVDLIQFSLFCL